MIEGEVVRSTERALSRGDSADLDSSLAIALSEAEINQQIATARRFPRQKQKAIDDIVELATADTATAAECIYSLPRGRDPETGKPKAIVGASIRFAELVAQCWGNSRVAARVVAIDRKEKFVSAEGIYHDLETNSAIKSEVRRRISDKRGGLFSEDMIIVTGNAAASIALRNAILRGIPKAVWARAYEKVEAVVAGDAKTIGSRRVELLTRFRDELGVKADVLYAILGVSGEMDVGREELVVAAGFFTALRQNEVTVEDLLRDAGVGAAGAEGVGHRTLAQAFGGPAKPAGTPETAATPPAGQPEPETAKPAPEPVKEPEPAFDPETGEIKDDGTREVELKQTPPAPAPPAATDFPEDEIQPDGESAGPGETYFLASDAWGEDGKRPTYQDGKPFSRAGRRPYEDGEIFIFTDHAAEVAAEEERPTETASAPVAEAAPASPDSATPASTASPEATSSQAQAEEPSSAGEAEVEQTRVASPEARGLALAVDEYRAKVKAAESYLSIKAALGGLRKVAAFAELPEDLRRPEMVFAYVHGDALAKANKDPVSITTDPSFYLLWLETEPPAVEVQDARQRLIRTEAYRNLKDVHKDQIAAATDKALGGDI